MELFDMVGEFGPLAGVVLFFLWKDWKREDRLSERIDKLEDEQREIILPLVENSTSVISRNTEVMERLERHLERFSDADQSKP